MKLQLGKLGAEKGHEKWTRKQPEPNEFIDWKETNCPNCRSELAGPYKIEKRIEEEIPNPRRIRVIEHSIHHYQCACCNKHIVARNKVPKSRFGKNVQSRVALLKFEDRLPLRKVETSLDRHYKLSITNPGIYGLTKQVAKKLSEPYYEIIKDVRSANIVYVDETKYKLNGKTWWLWTFVHENGVLFVIRKSRHKKVIEEILGKQFMGIIVSDGWVAYKTFAEILQRCWAHLLRECDRLEDNHNDFNFKNEQIHNLFKEIQKVREDPPPENQRRIIQKEMKDRLEFIARNMLGNYRFKKLGTKILNGLDSWFTCVVHTLVEPTNNFAEQALRELIVQRKIMGGLRSEDGAVILERTATCINTWKKQRRPLFETL
ncbi:MAG: IS66 family transposase [archaeon]